LDIGVLGYIGIVQHKEHSPEVLSIPPGTPCIQSLINMDFIKYNVRTCIKPKWNILIVNCITNNCICVTWQGSDYKFPEDKIVSSHVEVW